MFVRGPRMPTKEEKGEHALSQLQLWSWCRYCAHGSGREWPPKRVADEPGLQEMHADLYFLGDEGEPGQTLPMLVMRERSADMMFAGALPAKTSATRTLLGGWSLS